MYVSRVHIIPKIDKPLQNCTAQKGETKQVPYWRFTNIRHRRKVWSSRRPGALDLFIRDIYIYIYMYILVFCWLSTTQRECLAWRKKWFSSGLHINRPRYFVMSRHMVWYVHNKVVVKPGAPPSTWKRQWRGQKLYGPIQNRELGLLDCCRRGFRSSWGQDRLSLLSVVCWVGSAERDQMISR